MSITSGLQSSPSRGLPWAWIALGVAAALLAIVFYDGLRVMVEWWSARQEYSHGFVLPFVATFFVWQKRSQLEAIRFEGSWAGLVVILFGVCLYLAGELSALFVLVQYAFLLVLAGLALAFMGWRAFRLIWVPLAILFFMVPLPNFIYQGLSGQAQLVSSRIGVAVIRLFGISVFLEGNVIDLGSYKLQVAEACSGLRYLFPLMALGFIAAYVYRGEAWKRAVIFLSTIPITILMNSLRIGVIGVLVEYWGTSLAEGFIHDFEGWVIFMACTGVLVVEMWLLARIGPRRRSLADAFRIDFPARRGGNGEGVACSVAKPFVFGLSVLGVAALLSFTLPARVEASAPRGSFYEFPLTLDGWHGNARRLDQVELDALKLDDYILADFAGDRNRAVNFYVAYYASQRKGESAHSPRSCIPGGGWEITELTQREIAGVAAAGQPLHVNRVVIQKGDSHQLVYYWFQQRGRVITNEYLVKWFLFWDSLARNRTDGALVRLLTYVGPGHSIEEADAELGAFAGSVTARLDRFIPR